MKYNIFVSVFSKNVFPKDNKINCPNFVSF